MSLIYHTNSKVEYKTSDRVWVIINAEFGLSSMPSHYPPTQNVSVQKQRGEVSVFFKGI